MRILVFGINYHPEPTGIGKYTGELTEWLAARGHAMRVITAMPYYPWWRKPEGYRRWFWQRERRNGVQVLRCPLYVPRPDRVTSLRRMLHELTFTATAALPWLGVLLSPRRPDVIITVIPATQSAVLPVLVGRLRRIPVLVHAQDLQVDAALQLGMLRPRALGSVMAAVERFVLHGAAHVTTISGAMRDRIVAKGVESERVSLFPNWADPNVVPMDRDTEFRRTVLSATSADMVAMYAGAIGEKQGLDCLLDAAAALRDRPELRIVIVGAGSSKARLVARARDEGLDNVQFLDPQPLDALPSMLASADLHLVLQRSSASDLLLPSKLVNILASGRPCLVTADEGSTLAQILADTGAGRTCALDGAAIAAGVRDLMPDPAARAQMGDAGARYAAIELAADPVLTRFEQLLGHACGVSPLGSSSRAHA